MSLADVEALSGWELARWKAYHAVEPLPDVAWSLAQVCAVIANVNRSKSTRAFTVDDFLPRVGPAGPQKKRKMSTEEMLANFKAATRGCK